MCGGGGTNLRVFTKGGASLNKILILKPKLGVRCVNSVSGEKMHDFEIICPARGVRTRPKNKIVCLLKRFSSSLEELYLAQQQGWNRQTICRIRLAQTIRTKKLTQTLSIFQNGKWTSPTLFGILNSSPSR